MQTTSYDAITRFCMLSLLTVAVYLFTISNGYAATVGDILCDIYDEIQSDVGRGIATLAVATLGISALVGKVSWGMAIMVAVGIAVMYTADTIVPSISGVAGC